MKTSKIVFIILCTMILGIVILPWFISPIVHNIKLYGIESRLSNHALPPGTQLVEKQSVCGKLNGNGDGMDYLATILIHSDLCLEDLKKYYSFADVTMQQGEKLSIECLEHREIKYLKLDNISDFKGYYVVYIYDGGYSTYFDIRGS